MSGFSVTLTSKNGHFSIDSPSTISIGDLTLGKKTVTFQITGTSEGFDTLSVNARGKNKQHIYLVFSFSDSYSNSITVGHPEPTPAPSPTPEPTVAPSTTANPDAPTPVPSLTPAPISSPDATPTPAPTDQLSIQLTSPIDRGQWMAGTVQNLRWNVNGGTEPLIITLEYSTTGVEGPWTSIATSIPNNGSLTWKTPNTTSTVYICAVVIDSADSPQTASAMRSIEVTGANAEFPLILIPAMFIPAIAMITVLFKGKKRGGTTSASSV